MALAIAFGLLIAGCAAWIGFHLGIEQAKWEAFEDSLRKRDTWR